MGQESAATSRNLVSQGYHVSRSYLTRCHLIELSQCLVSIPGTANGALMPVLAGIELLRLRTTATRSPYACVWEGGGMSTQS